MAKGPFHEHRWVDSKTDEGVGLLKKRRSYLNECEAGEDRPDHGGSIHTPPIYFVSMCF